jgi:hypothetical protein
MFRALLATSLALIAVCAGSLVNPVRPETSAAQARVSTPGPQLEELLGFVDGQLVRLDPQTLRPQSGKRIRVGSGGCAPRQSGTACWTVPPWTIRGDGQFIAVARNGPVRKLRFVRVNPLYVPWDLPLDSGPLGAIAWLARNRVLAVEEIAGERQRLIAIDLPTQRITARRPLRGSVVQLARTEKELVLLLAPAQSVGKAQVAVADPRGRVRFARIGKILVGAKLLGTGSNHRVDARTPGLTVDPERRRAFVVGQSLAAEVDLRTLAVSYHALERPPSLLSRLWNWLEPPAAAKQVSGYQRAARWLSADRIAVSGTDTQQGRYQPAGLLLIDTRTWSVRTIDSGATSFRVSDDALLATGGSWDEATNRPPGIGLAAYGFDGDERFRVLEGEQAWIGQVYLGRAFVGIAGGAEPLRIVDLSTGLVVGTRVEPLPWLLLGAGAGWWDS